MNSARVFHRPAELKYVDTHYAIRNKRTGVRMFYQSHNSVLTHLVIGTDHKLRETEYMEQRALYEYYQYNDEENQDNQRKRIDAFIQQRDNALHKQNEIHAV